MYEKILAWNIHSAYNKYKRSGQILFYSSTGSAGERFRSSDQVIQGYSAGEIQREANDNRISEMRGSRELLAVSLVLLLYIATMTVKTVLHVSSARKG